MASIEDQELMERIGKLAGKINRHKHQNNSPNIDSNHATRGSYHRASPYPSNAHRSGRGRPAPTYRNKTLVLNGQNRTPTSTNESIEVSTPDTPSWVTKTDRHLQLINTSVYEKETQQRASAIEQTQRQKQFQNDHREKAQFLRSIRQGEMIGAAASSNQFPPASRYEIDVEGIRFHVTQQGSKLVKAPDDMNPPAATPKVTTIGGVKFFRTKNGNLVRHGIVKAQRRAGRINKVNEQCKAFSWTGSVFLTTKNPTQVAILCRLRYGSCPKGPTCRYIHDASKTAICKDFLQKGKCPRGDSCDLSHEITEERTPLCLHFAKGNCQNPSCPYVHAKHAQTESVCRAFGIYGYCDKGAQCPDRHVFECPDFSNTGVCKIKGCKRLHVERASVLRKANNRESSEEKEDLSSDDEDAAADSDDVNSDEVEDFIGQDDMDDLDFADQNDFIGFR